jgi:stearoyl-CoA desaturase (Delta-9 desaturase)
MQGPIIYWCRGHRSHHRYTDTDLDPYAASKGFFWSHIGWVILKHRRRPGIVDISDLRKNPVVAWSDNNYSWLSLVMAFVFPSVVAGFGWGDWKGGLVYAGLIRALCLLHVNILAVRSSSPLSSVIITGHVLC